VHEANFDTTKSRLRVQGTWPSPTKLRICTQCGLCVQACPTGALTIDAKVGGVRYERDLCDLCGECLRACPYDLPIMDDGVRICDLCGGWPECADWCPTKALEMTGGTTV